MTIIAIDPGPEKSAFVELRCGEGREMPLLQSSNILENPHMLTHVMVQARVNPEIRIVIEKIASYGMAVGAEVFETCVWTGQYIQAASPLPVTRITRGEVKSQICRSQKANDSNIRQALIDRYGGSASIKKGGPLHGVRKDIWAALAVGITYWETRKLRG